MPTLLGTSFRALPCIPHYPVAPHVCDIRCISGSGCLCRPVAAICQKPTLSLRQSSFFPFPLVDSLEGPDRARSPAARHFDAIYTNNLIKSTLMFTLIYYQVQKSACMQSSVTVGRTDTMDYRPYSNMAVKSGGVHICTPTARKWGVWTPGPPQDRRHWCRPTVVCIHVVSSMA